MITEEARQKMGWRKGKDITAYYVDCAECGLPFKTVPTSSKQKTCSITCSKKQRLKDRVRGVCPICLQEFEYLNSRKRKYCSNKCKIEGLAEQKRKALNSSDGGPRKTYRAFKEFFLKTFGSCQRCGWGAERGVLELHHKDRNRANNVIENLVLLCPNCHAIDHFIARDGQFKSNLGKSLSPSTVQ